MAILILQFLKLLECWEYHTDLQLGSIISEVHHYCEDCIKAIEEEREKNNSEDELKYCDHCKGMVKGVRPMRDPEEGSCGRLYYLCEQHRSVLLSSFVDDDDCSPQHYGYDD